jgi:hypothetical protein
MSEASPFKNESCWLLKPSCMSPSVKMAEGTDDFLASEDDFTGPSGVMGGRAKT